MQELAAGLALHDQEGVARLLDWFSCEETLFLVYEYVGMDAYTLLEKHGVLSERMAKGIARQLLRTLQACHSLGIAHRDVKPENVLLCGKHYEIAKLIDFGLCHRRDLWKYPSKGWIGVYERR